MSKRILHIGKHNIFGHYAESMGQDTVSHSSFYTSFSKDLLKNYDTLIISAFAPSNKIGEYNDELIHDVLCKVTGQTVIYISTCRISSPHISENHYVQSKKRQEDLLIVSNAGKTIVKRLPIVIPHMYLRNDIQGFLKQVSVNLRQKKSFAFDVSEKSTWNFVCISDVFSRFSILRSENIFGSHDIELGALRKALGQSHDVRFTSFGEEIVHYLIKNELPNFQIKRSISTLLEDIVNAV